MTLSKKLSQAEQRTHNWASGKLVKFPLVNPPFSTHKALVKLVGLIHQAHYEARRETLWRLSERLIGNFRAKKQKRGLNLASEVSPSSDIHEAP